MSSNAPPPVPTAPPPSAPSLPPPPAGAVAASSGTSATIGSLPPLMAPRVVLNAVEGWGKTSTGAFAPDPVILCATGENGYQTLLGAGLVPNIPAAVVNEWPEFLATLDAIAASCPYKTVVLDALGGFEAMCHRFVTVRDFKGDHGSKGFLNYHKGYDVSVTDWIGMLAKLDKIHAQGVAILALSHCQDKNHPNPMGEDYMKTIGSMHPKTWAATKRWTDAILYGKFLTIVDQKKGIGGTDRILYCEQRDAYDAKNRYGMEPELMIPKEPAKVWVTILNAMKKGT